MTHLRKRMLEELQRRNYSEGTTRAYLQAVQQFAIHFGKAPDKLGPDHHCQHLPSSLLIENASEQFFAPSASCPEAFPIKANDFPDKCSHSLVLGNLDDAWSY